MSTNMVIIRGEKSNLTWKIEPKQPNFPCLDQAKTMWLVHPNWNLKKKNLSDQQPATWASLTWIYLNN